MVNELFVYGTLMQQTDSPMARFLHGEARLLGAACLPGRLYDLGSYPGAVYDRTEERLIHGQIYTITHPDAVFPILDRYEGVSPVPLEPEEYVRALVPARFDGREVQCWIYLLNIDPAPFPLIESGNYLTYYARQVAHRQFIRRGR